MKSNNPLVPVRKIGKSHTSLTGKISSLKTDRLISFESSLERDFIEITNFNVNVESFVEQPKEIFYLDENGVERRYTPDFIIFYKNNDPNIPYQSPLLVEIKYREKLKKDWTILKPKFMAALRHCDEMGWKFKILTEVEIRTDYLFNAKFLSRYMNSEDVRIEDSSFLLDVLSKKKESTPKELINFCSDNEKRKAYLLYTLWHLIAKNMIGVDLALKLSMNSTIWDIYE